MKEIQKVVQKLSRGQESAAAAAAYEPVQKHKVTPGIPGWLNKETGWVFLKKSGNQYQLFVMPPPLGAGGIMFSGCPSVRPSVRPKPEIPSFDLYMGPLVHPTNRNRFTACPSVCPSVRPERFPGICRRMHGGIGLKFYMLMYLDHLQNWLVYGYGLLIFLILALFWLSETGQILGFRAFPGKRIEEMDWNFARRCILTTFRTD